MMLAKKLFKYYFLQYATLSVGGTIKKNIRPVFNGVRGGQHSSGVIYRRIKELSSPSPNAYSSFSTRRQLEPCIWGEEGPLLRRMFGTRRVWNVGGSIALGKREFWSFEDFTFLLIKYLQILWSSISIAQSPFAWGFPWILSPGNLGDTVGKMSPQRQEKWHPNNLKSHR